MAAPLGTVTQIPVPGGFRGARGALGAGSLLRLLVIILPMAPQGSLG